MGVYYDTVRIRQTEGRRRGLFTVLGRRGGIARFRQRAGGTTAPTHHHSESIPRGTHRVRSYDRFFLFSVPVEGACPMSPDRQARDLDTFVMSRCGYGRWGANAAASIVPRPDFFLFQTGPNIECTPTYLAPATALSGCIDLGHESGYNNGILMK